MDNSEEKKVVKKDHALRVPRKKLSATIDNECKKVDDEETMACNSEWMKVSQVGMSKLDEFSHPKYEYHPQCDSTIDFETIPVVAAVKDINDSDLEYKKEERCINAFTEKEQSIIQKEKVIMGWRLGGSPYLENSIYFNNKGRYRLGCLNKTGKLIIDFKYCIIEVVGKYIFAGYDGDYQHNTYQGLYDLYTIDGDFLFGGFTQ